MADDVIVDGANIGVDVGVVGGVAGDDVVGYGVCVVVSDASDGVVGDDIRCCCGWCCS